MKIISHRGNTKGPNKHLENYPDHISDLLHIHDVEIDVWYINDEWYLGHDYPIHKVDLNFLHKSGLWCHAKNLEALNKLLDLNIICFWHENDERTLTSNNYIWTFPSKSVCNKSIIVDLRDDWKLLGYKSYGVCVDYI